METTPPAQPERAARTDTAGSRGRLGWIVETGEHRHRLDLIPDAFGRSVSVLIDDRRISRVGKPDAMQPWREGRIVVDGEPITIGLVARGINLEVDVFREDRSLMDGRSIADARAAAPEALSRFQAVFGVVPAARRPLLPLGLGLGAIAALGVLVVSGLLSPTDNPVVWAALIVGLWYPLLLLMRSWGVVRDRAHAYALARHDLSDRARTLVFLGAFFGFMVISVVVFVGLELLLFVAVRFVQDAVPG